MGPEGMEHRDGIRCVPDSDGRNPVNVHKDGGGDMDHVDERYREWLRVLEEEVIQDGFGYEPGEFTVYPTLWRPLFDEGLTPVQAWTRALDAAADERALRERLKQENWERIQRADSKIGV